MTPSRKRRPASRPTRRRRDPDGAQEALKEAARTLFAAYGFHGTRTLTIAQLARVNKGLITYHFGGKRGLYSAILMEDIAAAQQQLLDAVPPQGTASDQLRALITSISDFGAQRPHFPFILTREQMAGSGDMDPGVRQAFFGFFQLTAAILARGIASGEFRQVDPHAVHLALIGSLVYFALTAPARQAYLRSGKAPVATAPDPEAYVAEMADLFLRGLRAPAPGASSPASTNPLRST